MDGEIVESLRAHLARGNATSLSALIRDRTLTVERFVEGLLHALGPFSEMMTDLLRLLEGIGARATDHSLAIEFDFGEAERLSLDLTAFRDWQECVARVQRLVRVEEWSSSRLWDLRTRVRGNNPIDRSRGAAAWVDFYRQSHKPWPPFPLPRPRTGDPKFDALLAKCFHIWSVVLRAAMATARDRRELNALLRDDDSVSEGMKASELALIDSDYWFSSMADAMHQAAEHAQSLPPSERRLWIDSTSANVEQLLREVPTREEQRTILTRELLAFLNLPAWKKRDQLYSAWVFTLISDALSDRDLRYHVVDNKLSFAFGGSHLATSLAAVEPLHVWAEIRSPLEVPSALSGRKSIQPDYTLLGVPFHNPWSAFAVVECKQYRGFSKKNFSRAVIDYANGRPRAQILLASYGPTKSQFLQTLPKDISERISLIGGLRPHHPVERKLFRDQLRSALESRIPLPTPLPVGASAATAHPAPRETAQHTSQTAQTSPQSLARTEATRTTVQPVTALSGLLEAVKLQWDQSEVDLDLHLMLVLADGRLVTVNYLSPGSLMVFPRAQLDDDARHGPATETITINEVLSATYSCFVHRFTVGSTLKAVGAVATIRLDGKEHELRCPSAESDAYWHLFYYNGDTSELSVINHLMPNSPQDVWRYVATPRSEGGL